MELWINADSQYGKQLQNDIKAVYGKELFGFLKLERPGVGATVYLTFRPYDTNDIFLNGYSKINSIGWHARWNKISLT